ncbi:MAG: phospho-sugar mutase [Thermoguttaceae bacterium]
MITQDVLQQLDVAAAAGKLSAGAVENIRTWLTAPYLAEYAPMVAEQIAAGKWQRLDDVFWTTIPFGTGGRRGRLCPIGTNAINDRTIGESAQGLADYVREAVGAKPLGCAIAYDTRHRSREFAELCARIMAAAGFKVWFLDGFRSTPETSFAVRSKNCDCGIMITASHNPPSDNAVKVYWSTGGQLLPPHDKGVIDRVYHVKEIARIPWVEGLASGQIEYCQEEVDAAFVAAVMRQSTPGPRDLKIIYSPLHGVGTSAVCPVLRAAGFEDVEVFGPHAAPDPDFTNVPGHVANPENAVIFDAMIARGKQIGADLILATDPDCDRLGCADRLTPAAEAAWGTLTGNQIGSLLTDALLAARKAAGTLHPKLYVVKTLVTTELIRRIADDYGVQTAGNLLVGFKYIGGEMDLRGPKDFVFGAEESYGFLAGDHVRDKDAAVASLLLAELAARLKARGKTLHQQLDELFVRYGCHSESQINVQMPGEQGMDAMKTLMAKFRSHPPRELGCLKLARVRDYLNDTVTIPGGKPAPLGGPKGDMVILDLEVDGNYVAVRPSGTEPKVKFYMFAYDPPTTSADLAATKAAQAARIKAFGDDLRKFSGT